MQIQGDTQDIARLFKGAKHEAYGTQEADEHEEREIRVVGFGINVVASLDEEMVGQDHHPDNDQPQP